MKNKKIKESKVDQAFSLYIRHRDNWTCVLCGKSAVWPTNEIQCSHFYRRGHRSVRFDPENCDALCRRCHYTVERDKNGVYMMFKMKQLGRKKFNGLFSRRYSFRKFSQDDYREMIDKFTKLAEEIVKQRDEEIFGKH